MPAYDIDHTHWIEIEARFFDIISALLKTG